MKNILMVFLFFMFFFSKMKLYLGGKVFFNCNLVVRISLLFVIIDRLKYDLIIFFVDVNIFKIILGIFI